MTPAVVVVTPEQLSEIVRAAVADALAAQRREADEPAHVSVEQAAERLGCSTRQVRRYIATGRLRASRAVPGKGSSRVRIETSSVDALLKAE